jgi:hypothetical protein
MMPYQPYNLSAGFGFGSQYGNDYFDQPYAMSRMKNIFQQPEDMEDQQKKFLSGVTPFRQGQLQVPNSSFNSQSGTDPNAGYLDEVNRLSQPGPNQSAYTAALKDQPTWDKYQPSKTRRGIGALLGAAVGYSRGPVAGAQIGGSVVEAPYQHAVSDYERKMKGLGPAAQMEQQDQKDQLQAIYQARALGLNYDKFKQDKLEAEQKHQLDMADYVLKRNKNLAEIAHLNQDDYSFTDVEGGIQAVNKNNPRDTFVIPAKTVAAAKLATDKEVAATGAANAYTNRMNAGTNAKNAETNAAGQKDTERYRTGLLSKPTPQGSADQKTAMELSLKSMVSDPKFAGLIVTNSDGSLSLPPNDGSPAYNRFVTELQKRVRERNPLGQIGMDEIPDQEITAGFRGVR